MFYFYFSIIIFIQFIRDYSNVDIFTINQLTNGVKLLGLLENFLRSFWDEPIALISNKLSELESVFKNNTALKVIFLLFLYLLILKYYYY